MGAGLRWGFLPWGTHSLWGWISLTLKGFRKGLRGSSTRSWPPGGQVGEGLWEEGLYHGEVSGSGRRAKAWGWSDVGGAIRGYLGLTSWVVSAALMAQGGVGAWLGLQACRPALWGREVGDPEGRGGMGKPFHITANLPRNGSHPLSRGKGTQGGTAIPW